MTATATIQRQGPVHSGTDHLSGSRAVMLATDLNGPIRSGHGGVASGRFAEFVDPIQSTVRLHNPIPLGAPMHPRPCEQDRSGIAFVAGDTLIATATARREPLTVSPFTRLSRAEVLAAEKRWMSDDGVEHPCPTCFACGTARDPGTGLGLRPGRADCRGLFGSTWTPAVNGDLPAWLIWAALDCPSGAPALDIVNPDQMAVTGQLAVDIKHRAPGDRSYQLLGRLRHQEGRKMTTESALIDEYGNEIAIAVATWFAVPRPTQGTSQDSDPN